MVFALSSIGRLVLKKPKPGNGLAPCPCPRTGGRKRRCAMRAAAAWVCWCQGIEAWWRRQLPLDEASRVFHPATATGEAPLLPSSFLTALWCAGRSCDKMPRLLPLVVFTCGSDWDIAPGTRLFCPLLTTPAIRRLRWAPCLPSRPSKPGLETRLFAPGRAECKTHPTACAQCGSGFGMVLREASPPWSFPGWGSDR